MGVLRAEHTSALDDQRSSFRSQVQNLQSQINTLNTRVEALLVQLSQRDDENSSLKVSLEGKDKALLAAVAALEAIRDENKARDEQAEKEKARAEEEARNRPKVCIYASP
jgi:regulator of replication initiation timing